MKAAVFFERDGILNHARVENRLQVIPKSAEDFRINQDALASLKRLKAAGYLLIATTNQPGISEGIISRWDIDRMHGQLMKQFPLSEIMVCPHEADDDCPCRKPRPGLFTEAAFKWHLDLDRSFVISDKWYDGEAALNTGCTSLLIESPWISEGHHDFVLPSLPQAVNKILQLAQPQAWREQPSVA